MTTGLEHGCAEARDAAAAGETTLVLSGDGLVGQVGGALANSGAAMGVLPGGRGNDLARVLGIPTDPEGAVAVVAGGRDPRDRRRRDQRHSLPRHRELRLRLRRQPHRQRGEARARSARLPLRGAQGAERLASGDVQADAGRARGRRARLLGRRRQQQGLRRRDVRRARRRARRRPPRRRLAGRDEQGSLSHQGPAEGSRGHPRQSPRGVNAPRRRGADRGRPAVRGLCGRRPRTPTFRRP